MDMLGDAVEVAAAGGTTVDFASLAPNFTNASIQFEVAWGALGPGSAPNETLATKQSGDTFELAAAALATRGVPSSSTDCPLHYLGSWQLVPGKNPCFTISSPGRTHYRSLLTFILLQTLIIKLPSRAAYKQPKQRVSNH
jgi:hypothetical protein